MVGFFIKIWKSKKLIKKAGKDFADVIKASLIFNNPTCANPPTARLLCENLKCPQNMNYRSD